ncbi:MAG: SEC-C domain-containing protein [Rhodobacteraceae bacterium]|nr:SEC-C domain-containing protein [Paracoccaceae bacterium]
MFGDRNKAQTLQDLGLLDENWQWSEVGFQREQALLRDVRGKEISPSLEWLRWELHCRHHRKDPFPLSWALMNDFMSEPILYRARRLASVALSGGLLGEKIEIGETITPEQFSMLRKLGAWIHTKPAYHEEQNLWWLGFIAKQDNLSWKNWEQICSFVYGKLDQTPDYELLQDWKDGVVTFEGRGRHQENSEEPFKGKTKVGRNDPCPCNSGKKYKKCCGR